MQTIKEPR